MAEITNRKQIKVEKNKIKEINDEKIKENNEKQQNGTKDDAKPENNNENNNENKIKEIQKKKVKKITFCDVFLQISFFMILIILIILSFALFIQLYVLPGGNKFNFGDILSNNQLRTRNQRVDIQVPLSYVYSGEPIHFEKERVVKCKTCEGSGSTDHKNYQCEYCKGMGTVIQKRNMGFMIYESQTRCPKCQGSGSNIPQHLICSKCGGRGLHHSLDHIILDVPPGLPPSVPLLAKGKADEQIGYETGDLECFLHTVDHPRFIRVDEIHLSLESVISLADALLGFTIEIERIDETTLTYTRKEILQPNERVVIKGEGMPIYGKPNQRGDLFITFSISFPSSLSSSDISRLKQLFPN